jgi:hypothetical protein
MAQSTDPRLGRRRPWLAVSRTRTPTPVMGCFTTVVPQRVSAVCSWPDDGHHGHIADCWERYALATRRDHRHICAAQKVC